MQTGRTRTARACGIKGIRLEVHRELPTEQALHKLCLLLPPFIANMPVFQKQDHLKQLLHEPLPLRNARLATKLIAVHMHFSKPELRWVACDKCYTAIAVKQ